MQRAELCVLGVVGALLVALCAQNLRVGFLNAKLKAELDARLKRETAVSSPAVGQTIPMLQGRDFDGAEFQVNLPASFPKVTLLVVEPDDPEVERNFSFWDKLLSDDELVLIVVTTDAVPSDYVQRHPHLAGHHIVRLDQKVARDLGLQATPQTVYLHNGVVTKTWFGLLSDSDLKDIRASLKRDWKWNQ